MSSELSSALPRTLALIQQGIEERWHLGVQLYVSRAGRVLADAGVGWNAEGDPLDADRLMLWLSAGKPLTAVAVLQLAAASEFDLHAPVAIVIPEFGAAGKQDVTIAQLLTHTGALKPVATGWPHLEWDDIVARICAAPLRTGASAGSHAAYDPARSWFILGEIIRRCTGLMVHEAVRQRICLPLGMQETYMAMDESTFHSLQHRLANSYQSMDDTFALTKSHTWENCRTPSPGGSLRGPVRELGRFYECLLRGGTAENGDVILPAEWVREMQQRQRVNRYDETFQHTVDFGWGVIVNSNRYGAETVPYGFGRHAGDEAYGHGGSQSAIGFADPQHEVVVAMVANGMPGEAPHNQRFRELNTAIYEDLGIA